MHRAPCPPTAPAPGLSEFDPVALAQETLKVTRRTLSEAQEAPVAVGIANQRCSTLLWRRSSGKPVGLGLSWGDLRTAGKCLELQASNLRLAPNQTATKAAHLIAEAAAAGAAAASASAAGAGAAGASAAGAGAAGASAAGAGAAGASAAGAGAGAAAAAAAGAAPPSDLCVGTLDSWLTWHLTEGAEHVTDASNAAIGGLCRLADGSPVWNLDLAAELGIPPLSLPRIVDSSGILGRASALPGSPPISGLIGDQQASLIGSGCVRPGDVKITFGTAGMLNMNLGEDWYPDSETAAIGGTSPGGSYPIAAWKRHGRTIWGLEAMMFSAGSCVDWFCGLSGLLSSPQESHALASACENSGRVTFVPALDGLGAPSWDFGARGAIFGIDAASQPSHLLRALLEGIAQRGVDLIETAESDSGMPIQKVRVDGGMSTNTTFLQALADSSGRTVIAAPEVECTALGAAFMAGVGVGVWSSVEETADLRDARSVVRPLRELDRTLWSRRLEGCREWHPEFSAISF